MDSELKTTAFLNTSVRSIRVFQQSYNTWAFVVQINDLSQEQQRDADDILLHAFAIAVHTCTQVSSGKHPY